MATICDFKDGELVFHVGRRGLPLLTSSGAIAAGDVRSDTTKRVAFAVGDGALCGPRRPRPRGTLTRPSAEDTAASARTMQRDHGSRPRLFVRRKVGVACGALNA